MKLKTLFALAIATISTSVLADDGRIPDFVPDGNTHWYENIGVGCRQHANSPSSEGSIYQGCFVQVKHNKPIPRGPVVMSQYVAMTGQICNIASVWRNKADNEAIYWTNCDMDTLHITVNGPVNTIAEAIEMQFDHPEWYNVREVDDGTKLDTIPGVDDATLTEAPADFWK